MEMAARLPAWTPALTKVDREAWKHDAAGEFRMNINLPADQEDLIAQLVRSGQFGSVDEVISESLRLLVSLRDQVSLGIEQADRGAIHDHDTVFMQLRSRVAAS
jgi:Arc/MetJ-type ribon-helix-helix transcriptional regulator